MSHFKVLLQAHAVPRLLAGHEGDVHVGVRASLKERRTPRHRASRKRTSSGAAFGFTTLAHKEETAKTDKKGGESVRQLPGWVTLLPDPLRGSPAWGNVCAPVGKGRLQTQGLHNLHPSAAPSPAVLLSSMGDL
ncbi:hypothetical protein EYF80_000862 [Liparis tanakae]|uniref:Uncharacterized protein n=1 Tax=Liparis tanakae TaxID=230148 RepID=A0A4Z2JGW3_9TELE|nr:hypothetical protein EYF80_000862 [Liparis tanakae]